LSFYPEAINERLRLYRRERFRRTEAETKAKKELEKLTNAMKTVTKRLENIKKQEQEKLEKLKEQLRF